MKPKNGKINDYSIYFEHYKKLIKKKQQVYVKDTNLIETLDTYFKSINKNIHIIPNGSGAILQLFKN